MIDTKYIREKILDLAVRGKLVDQDPKDGDARDLLEEIQKEKEELIKAKKIKREKKLPEIIDEEIPFEIPDNWVWVRLGEVTNYGNNVQVKPELIESNSYIIELEDIDKFNNKLLSCDKNRIIKSSKNKFSSGEVLYGKLRPYLKKCIIAEFSGYCSTEIMPFIGYSNIYSSYILHYMMSPFINQIIDKITYGVNLPRLGTKDARNLPFPLPPLAEQERIVEKIEEAFALLDEIEEAQDHIRILGEQIKSKTLDMAVRGELVPQDPSDGNAKDLLKEIQAEKENLIKAKKIKKEKKFPEIGEEEIPFDIPDNWLWVRLGDVTNVIMGQSPPGSTVFDGDDEIEFHQGKTYFSDKYLNPSNKFTTKPKKILDPENIVLSVRAPVGKVNLNPNTICIGRGLCGLVTYKDLSNLFIYYYLCNLEKTFIMKSTGTTFQAINKDTIVNQILALPPLTEQERIVEKIEEIFAAVDAMIE